MTSLRRLVDILRLKTLVVQLSVNDLDEFNSALAKISNDHKIMSSSFNFMNLLNKPELMNKMMKMILDIIQNQTRNADQVKITKIEQLPSPILGEVASYLDQGEYPKFSRTNSTIFIASNSPNTLIKIRIPPRTQLCFKDILRNHPFIMKLDCNVTKFDQLKGIQPVHFVVNHLRELEIYKYDDEAFDIEHMLTQKYINFEHLKFMYSECRTGKTNTMYRILSKSHNVEKLIFLDIQDVITIEDDIENARNTLPNLKDLTFNVCGGIEWLQAFGPQLEKLELICIDVVDICMDLNGHDLKNIHFGKLQKLTVEFFSTSQLNAIVGTAKNLKELKIYNHISYDDDAKDIQQLMSNLIINLEKLQHLHVMICYVEDWDVKNGYDLMFDGIVYGLCQTKTRNRDRFEITFECVDGFIGLRILYLKKLLKQLIASNIKQFVMRICYGYDPEHKQRQIIEDQINNLDECVASIRFIKLTDSELIIQNYQ